MSKKVFRDVKKFTIKRNKWLRGNKFESELLNSETGEMCCLGFYALACGLSKPSIKDIETPALAQEVLDEKNNRWDSFLINEDQCDSEIANRLMSINDSIKTSDALKEKDIKRIFDEQGIKVEFINGD